MLKSIKKMKNKTKNIIILLSIITVLLLAFIIYFKLHLNEELKYIEEVKKNNFIALENIHEASGLKNKVKEVDEVEEIFDEFFIDKNNVLGFIETIEKIATTSNVSLVIENVTPDDTHINESLPYGILNMTLTARGSYDSINMFLKNLEKLPYYVDFNGIKMVAIGEKGNSEWSINMTLTTLTK